MNKFYSLLGFDVKKKQTSVRTELVAGVVTFLVELIVSLIKKTEKTKWTVSTVAIIVSPLFAVYFFVPASLFG